MKSASLVVTVRSLVLTLAMAFVLLATPAYAHHSSARFDRANTGVLTGTVKEFKWGNPHTWIYLVVPNEAGSTDVWELEGSAVNTLLRSGWTINTLKPGMKVSLLVMPLKDGGHGGAFTNIVEIDGQPFKPAAAAH